MTDWPKGVGLKQYDTIDSTNEEARRLAAAGETGPLWIAAREQTKGRGRRGREWISQSGNLFATLLMPAPKPATGQLAFVAGLAAGDTVAHYASPVTLKWPNDVLLAERKAGGILIEAFGESLAAGIGVNLAHFPAETEFPATSIKENTGHAPVMDEAFAFLAARWAEWYEVWRRSGFARIREAWLARAAFLNQTIRARLEGRDVTGIFEGLDEDGALLLRTSGGARERIAAGDVFV